MHGFGHLYRSLQDGGLIRLQILFPGIYIPEEAVTKQVKSGNYYFLWKKYAFLLLLLFRLTHLLVIHLSQHLVVS